MVTRRHRKENAMTEETKKATHFGEDVFGEEAIKTYLSKDTAKKLQATIREGKPLDPSIANEVAHGIRHWAMDRGATHYTHWFLPMTGSTAEKHDSFLELKDGEPIMLFSGKNLIVGEPDASSFPSGGIRSTFEARGYTAWDPTSPAFIKRHSNGATLCIPTAFCAYTGESLDKKTPLLRSMQALDKSLKRLMKLFGRGEAHTGCTLGAEQEYFLVDKEYWKKRPDLVLTGRTLFGAPSAKGQQLEDHYFGTIPDRVLSFMNDVERELWKLGIPAKTRHNEVAPAQFELAPQFEELNLASDHNMLIMDALRNVAEKHGFKCLLHEKPFAGVNGSGKHNNWSVAYGGKNLLDPGTNPDENAVFLTMLIAVIEAVDRHADLLRASVAGAGNDHRLGANEAPPAVISIYVGDQLAEVLDRLENGGGAKSKGGGAMKIGVDTLPVIPKDATDRNRTSPFAFTGNRFEFRAVGSEANCACAMIALNGAVAEQLVEFKQHVDALIANGMDKREALIKEIQKLITYCKPIRFDGNGYSEEWKAEAARRGLDCETSAPNIFKAYANDTSVRMFESLSIMNRAELEARNEIKWEIYTKKIQIEARIFGDMALNHIIPVATKYQGQLVDNVYKMKEILGTEGEALSASNINLIRRIASLVHAIESGVAEMIECRKVANRIQGQYEKALAYHDTVAPKLEVLRTYIDDLEEVVDDSLWPLPKYRELLFIR